MPDQDHASLPDWLPELEALCGYALERSLTVGEATQRRDEFSRKCGPRTVVELVDLIKAQREEIATLRRMAGVGCDAADGGPHEIIAQGSYKFCGACGETVTAPKLIERVRAAEARAAAAESQLAALRQGPVSGDYEEALRLAEIGEYLYSEKAFTYGDGCTQPREFNITWDWQQSRPNEFGQGVLLAEAAAWHDELAKEGVQTEAAKLRLLLSAIPTGGEGEGTTSDGSGA